MDAIFDAIFYGSLDARWDATCAAGFGADVDSIINTAFEATY